MGHGEGQGPQRCVPGGWTHTAGIPVASGFLRLQDPLPHFLPLLPPGPRKGEELEEEWAPTERVSE